MKNHILRLLLALCSCALISCVGSRNTATITTSPDGSVVQQLSRDYAQLGGNTRYHRGADGSETFDADLSQSFGHAMTATGLAIGMLSWANVTKASNAAVEATKQLSVKSAAGVSTEGIKATANTAQILGSNPEANVGAINAVGNLFGKP
jgi:hypothetical protein